jgi:hypothetical protein
VDDDDDDRILCETIDKIDHAIKCMNVENGKSACIQDEQQTMPIIF